MFINTEKLKSLRGERSLEAIAAASNGAFSDVALYKWERGKMQPKEDNLKLLLKIYGCKLEDIADQLDLSVSV